MVSTTVLFPVTTVVFPVPVSMEPWECFHLGDFEIGVGDFVCEDIANVPSFLDEACGTIIEVRLHSRSRINNCCVSGHDCRISCSGIDGTLGVFPFRRF